MSILAVKYQTPLEKKRPENRIPSSNENETPSDTSSFDPETNNTVHKLELFTHGKLGKDRATAEISEKPIFQFSGLLPLFKFPVPVFRWLLLFPLSPFRLVTTK